MGVVRIRRKYKVKECDAKGSVLLTFTRHWWDHFRPLPHIFKFENSPRSEVEGRKGFPLRNSDNWLAFNPEDVLLNGDSPFTWLREMNLPGKVTMLCWYAAWYPTTLGPGGAWEPLENGYIIIRFSNKDAAAMFKLRFYCPELEQIPVTALR